MADLPVAERVHILMFDATRHGGVARTVTALANQLARKHQVEILSVLRNSDDPQFPIDPRVQVRWLVDNRNGARPRRNPLAPRKWRRLDSLPSALPWSRRMLASPPTPTCCCAGLSRG